MTKLNSLRRTNVFILIMATFAFTQTTIADTAKKTKKLKTAYPESYLANRFTSWGIDPSYKKSSINLLKSWEKFEKKKSITVAVVDTGIQFDHPFLKDNIYTTTGKATIGNYGVDFSRTNKKNETVRNNTPSDSHGHGTHVAGIIKSIFPEVKIIALKYYNPKASGTQNLKATIKALRYAVNNNVDIINYSGGGPEPSEEERKIQKT